MKLKDETLNYMERIYRDTAEDAIPWTRTEPPGELTALLKSGLLLPCRALDIGSGTGNYSLYLAREGFSVTGLDISASAVSIARGKVGDNQGPKINFEVIDVAADVSKLPGPGHYGFGLEWMIMHHIFPEKRAAYVRNLAWLLAGGALALSVSFSSEDPAFGDPPRGAWRRSPMGPMVYCSGLDELVGLFSNDFKILNSAVIDIPGKVGTHRANYLLLRRKDSGPTP